MTSTLLKITLQPQSPFVTPLASDTLFGQLCWTIRHSLGEATLHQLLEGYTQGKPFVVLSDALPQAHIPRPSVPLSYLGYQLNDPKKAQTNKISNVVTAHTRVTLPPSIPVARGFD